MNIAFIGFGNMAAAIANGILSNESFAGAKLFAYDPFGGKTADFDGKVERCETLEQAANSAKYIFLCIKPQGAEEMLPQLGSALGKDHVVVSIMAGVSVEKIAQWLGHSDIPIVRLMPNTPLLVGNGTTAIARPNNISDADYQFVFDVFNGAGMAVEIPADKFNEVIPVNGSSPAFAFLFAKIIAKQAEKQGLDFKDSLNMFANTMKGAADMMLSSGMEIDDLISMVCSKGGTTIAAIEAMQAAGFEQAVEKGFLRCIERAYELG